ncbi:hypothetical protein L3Q82_008854, partial [Scortum barcoo]
MGAPHNCNAAICSLSSYTTQTHVINYEDEWLPPARQHGLLLRLGMGHSGHEGQSYHGSPAGSGSSGPLIDPSPAEQTAALDVTLVPHPGHGAGPASLQDSSVGTALWQRLATADGKKQERGGLTPLEHFT